MASPVGIFFLDHFTGLRGPRQAWKAVFPLPEMLSVVLCITLAGPEHFGGIHHWARLHSGFVRRFLFMPAALRATTRVATSSTPLMASCSPPASRSWWPACLPARRTIPALKIQAPKSSPPTARPPGAPTAKLWLAAPYHLFDWLVTGGVLPTNPAVSAHGPRHAVKVGYTPVLEPAEARSLLDATDVTTPIGLRDRVLIGLMIYSFARVGAALSMQVEDVFTRRRRLWVRLQEEVSLAEVERIRL